MFIMEGLDGQMICQVSWIPQPVRREQALCDSKHSLVCSRIPSIGLAYSSTFGGILTITFRK